MSLRRKLAIMFTAIFVLVVVQAAFVMVVLTQVVQGSALLVGPALTRIDLLAHAEADILRIRTLQYSIVWSSHEMGRAQALHEIDSVKDDVNDRVGRYEAMDLDLDRAAAVSRVRADFAELLDSQDKLVSLAAAGNQTEALWEYLRSQPVFQSLDDRVHALRHREYLATETLRDQMVQAADLVRWPLVALVMALALAEVGIGWAIIRSIDHGIRVLRQGARRIAQEDFQEPIHAPPEPELAALADTLNGVMLELATSRAARTLLEKERIRLLQERVSQVVRAQEEERARVSRELHDQAGQALTALQYGLTHARAQATDPTLLAEMTRLEALAFETTKQIGALARDLRPGVLDDFGLVPALRAYVREFAERIGIPVVLSVRGPIPRLAPDAETATFRVVQESLTNIAKHAQAAHAWVTLSMEDERLVASIRDDGRGCDAKARDGAGARRGLGLTGIQERVRLLGGTFEFTSEPGKGTEVRVSVPGGLADQAASNPREELVTV